MGSLPLVAVHPEQAMARKAIAVPHSSAAAVVLREQLGKHPENVFTYRGKPVRQVNGKSWKGTLARAGIEAFRWHDLRHYADIGIGGTRGRRGMFLVSRHGTS